MKRILLFVAALVCSMGFAEAQFVQSPASGTVTGMSFTAGAAGTNVTTAGVANWGAYTPTYSNSGCTVYSGAYLGGAGSTTSAGPKDTTNEIAYVAAKVVNQYDNYGGTTCYPNAPASISFAINTGSIGAMDLSASANQTLSISIKSNVSFTLSLVPQDVNYAPVITSSQPPIKILGDGNYHNYTLNFDTCTFSGTANAVHSVAFLYNSTDTLNGEFYINAMKIGSASTPCTPTALTPSIGKSINGLTVNFTGSNTGGSPAFVNWDFGDNTAHGTNTTPSHTYAKAGSYTVMYSVYDATCNVPHTTTTLVTVSAVTSVSAAQANIASSNMYPNPSADMTHIDMNLVAPSDVKITLSDALGKEVFNAPQGTVSTVSYDIPVSNLNKGVYTVTYYINGTAAQSNLLLVK